tara:strand:+ start:443 stop:1687 length:1245 start_codon:yes stop_codon:yes gene_type:complete
MRRTRRYGRIVSHDTPDDANDSLQKEKPKYEPPPRPTTRIGRKKRKAAGPNASAKLPAVYPTSRCKLRYLRMQRIHDHLLLEEEYVENQERLRKAKAAKEGGAPVAAASDPEAQDRNADERGRVDDMRGSPMGVGTLEEMIDDDHAIVSSTTGPEYYVSIMSFVDKDLLEPGASVLLHHKSVSIVGVLTDDADPLVTVMKLDKAPTESYADIGGLESQIQEVRESVELPLLHPELYEEMGIKPPKGVILYGAPGTGKTLLAKAVANQTSATFLRIVGSELIQKYLGDGPRLVRQLFQVCVFRFDAIFDANLYRLLLRTPLQLCSLTKLMQLVPSDTSLHLEERRKSKELCWSFSINWMVSMIEEMLRSLWPRTRSTLLTLPSSDLDVSTERSSLRTPIKSPSARSSLFTHPRCL